MAAYWSEGLNCKTYNFSPEKDHTKQTTPYKCYHHIHISFCASDGLRRCFSNIYLSNRVDCKLTTKDVSSLPSAERMFHDTNTEKLINKDIDEATAGKKLDKIRPDKAAGTDESSPRILNELKEEIWYPVLSIMASSIDTGVVPDDWKTAYVTPTFKKRK